MTFKNKKPSYFYEGWNYVDLSFLKVNILYFIFEQALLNIITMYFLTLAFFYTSFQFFAYQG